jgi:ribosomal protein S18 acetylase RimI-like enzyme
VRGHLDRLDHGLHGWVVDSARPAASLDLILLVDGIPRARGRANQPRPDVAAAGLGGPACGFALVLPAECLDGAEHMLALQVPGWPPFQLPGLPARVVLGLPRFCVAPAVPEMLDATLALLRQTHVESALDPALVEPAVVQRWLGEATDPGRRLLKLARANGRLVGYAEVDRRLVKGTPAGLLRMSVLAAYRRRGIGEALLARAEARAGGLGDAAMWLTVAEANHPARALYRKHGFQRAEQVPLLVWRHPDGLAKIKLLQVRDSS